MFHKGWSCWYAEDLSWTWNLCQKCTYHYQLFSYNLIVCNFFLNINILFLKCQVIACVFVITMFSGALCKTEPIKSMRVYSMMCILLLQVQFIRSLLLHNIKELNWNDASVQKCLVSTEWLERHGTNVRCKDVLQYVETISSREHRWRRW